MSSRQVANLLTRKGNQISLLNEICQKIQQRMIFRYFCRGNIFHKKHTVICSVAEFTTKGSSWKRKIAKKEACMKMLQSLDFLPLEQILAVKGRRRKVKVSRWRYGSNATADNHNMPLMIGQTDIMDYFMVYYSPIHGIKEIAIYNKITYEYRFLMRDTSEGRRRFTIGLRLGHEEFIAEKETIVQGKVAVAAVALLLTAYPKPHFGKDVSSAIDLDMKVEITRQLILIYGIIDALKNPRIQKIYEELILYIYLREIAKAYVSITQYEPENFLIWPNAEDTQSTINGLYHQSSDENLALVYIIQYMLIYLLDCKIFCREGIIFEILKEKAKALSLGEFFSKISRSYESFLPLQRITAIAQTKVLEVMYMMGFLIPIY